MECLTPDEIQLLIDLLGKITDIDQYHVRKILLAGVPPLLQNNISGGDTHSHLTSIVTTLGHETYFKLEDGSYPIIAVIRSAQGRVRGTSLSISLQKFLVNLCLRCRIALPETPIPFPVPVLKSSVPSIVTQSFQEELEECIAAVEELQAKLPHVTAVFSSHIFPVRCREVSSWLEDCRISISTFASSLQLSNHPPLAVIADGVWLTRELACYDKEAQTLTTIIQDFCQMYGSALKQPQEKREEIRQELVQLKQRCESVLEEARKLARKIDDQFIHLIERDRLP